MQITIFGASGKTGREVVKLALNEGHSVNAFVHSSNPFAPTQRLTITKGDITDIDSTSRAIQGSEAVISCLSTFKAKNKAIVSTGTENIIRAMQAQSIRRIISLTGSGALWEQDDARVLDRLNHTLLLLVAGKILKDGEAHLRLLAVSNLDWTTIRSPIMTGKGADSYHLSLKLPLPWATIPRPAVARCLVDQLSNETSLHSAPVIYKA